MPELPEVETVRRRLAPHLTGRTIVRARIDDDRLVRPEPREAVAARLAGTRVTALDRRGKHLLVRLDDGATLAIHLRMTGNLLVDGAGTSPTSGRCSSSTTRPGSRTPTSAGSAPGRCWRANRSWTSSWPSGSGWSRWTRSSADAAWRGL